jgi:hypothetical protein
VEHSRFVVVADGPGDARNLQYFRDKVFVSVDEYVRIEQRNLYFLFAITPLAHYLLHGKEHFIPPSLQEIFHLFFVAAFGVEGVPVFSGCRFQVSSFRLQVNRKGTEAQRKLVSGYWLPVSSCQLQVSSFKFQVSSSKFQVEPAMK